MLIAIDGPAASGKGTIAKLLGQKFNLPVLHTGNIYRAIAYKIWQKNQAPEELSAAISAANDLKLEDLNNLNLDQEIIGSYASIISAYPEVRDITYKFQRNFIDLSNGAIIEGRDIGTVICPEAKFKFYITADVEVRAKRRASQLENADYQTILADLKIRDEHDSKRLNEILKHL